MYMYVKQLEKEWKVWTWNQYYADSMKFFLSLYGHKLPVLCMDISSDSTLLLTGSSDKNIKAGRGSGQGRCMVC